MKGYKIEIKWAIIFEIVILVWMIIEKMLGYHSDKIAQHEVFSNFFMIPAILTYFLALREKKMVDYGGRITYGQAFMAGIVITAIVTVLAPLSQYITTNYISPEYFPNMINYVVSTNQLNQEQADAYFNLKNYIIQSIFATPLMGMMTTGILSFIVKSKNTK